jgi:uncharacterized protein YukE
VATFRVVSDELTAAAVLVGMDHNALTTAQGNVTGDTGALTGTPAAGAYEDFLSSLTPAVSTASQAIGSLEIALREAAAAYTLADQSAASSLGVKGTP